MAEQDFKAAYRTIMDDHFPRRMEITFDGDGGRQTLHYEKVTWLIDGVEKGLRYGENPGQESAAYRLVNGNLALGEVESIPPVGSWRRMPNCCRAASTPVRST